MAGAGDFAGPCQFLRIGLFSLIQQGELIRVGGFPAPGSTSGAIELRFGTKKAPTRGAPTDFSSTTSRFPSIRMGMASRGATKTGEWYFEIQRGCFSGGDFRV